MFFKKNIFVVFLSLFSVSFFAQKHSIQVKGIKVKGNLSISKRKYDPLAPSKAAFYSAVFPGMGQIYNKKYWKAPIVWAALGTSIYFYLRNSKQYNRYRTAFRLRKYGLQDEFTDNQGNSRISLETLQSAQKQLKENEDLSLLITAVLYALQIVEASVNAHLLQFDTDDNLSFEPAFIPNPIQINTPFVGLTLKYTF